MMHVFRSQLYPDFTVHATFILDTRITSVLRLVVWIEGYVHPVVQESPPKHLACEPGNQQPERCGKVICM